jgi:hypothetical protein
MHAKNSELFIGFLSELCGIPLCTLRENFIPRKDRRVGRTQRTQSFLLDFLASFAVFLCAFCVKISFLAKTAEVDARKDRNILYRIASRALRNFFVFFA